MLKKKYLGGVSNLGRYKRRMKRMLIWHFISKLLYLVDGSYNSLSPRLLIVNSNYIF